MLLGQGLARVRSLMDSRLMNMMPIFGKHLLNAHLPAKPLAYCKGTGSKGFILHLCWFTAGSTIYHAHRLASRAGLNRDNLLCTGH